MYPFVSIGNIILLIVLFLIFYVHFEYFTDSTSRLVKIMLALSFLIFVMIFVEHMIYVRKNEEKNAEEYVKYVEYTVNPNNMAIRLWAQLLMHPIFHIY